MAIQAHPFGQRSADQGDAVVRSELKFSEIALPPRAMSGADPRNYQKRGPKS
jgi:hypothetical protein